MPAEDAKLTEAVNRRSGTKGTKLNWVDIALEIPERSNYQCKHRWNHINRTIRSGDGPNLPTAAADGHQPHDIGKSDNEVQKTSSLKDASAASKMSGPDLPTAANDGDNDDDDEKFADTETGICHLDDNLWAHTSPYKSNIEEDDDDFLGKYLDNMKSRPHARAARIRRIPDLPPTTLVN